MDSLLVEALAESRRVLEELPDMPQTRRLRWRREALERAASRPIRRRVAVGAVEEMMD